MAETLSAAASAPDKPAFDLSVPRDRHLFGPGPKRILSLDGGGTRGIISIAFLERIEELLQQQAGPDARLCDYFDLIGGTSTGAIIGSALALGMSAKEVKDVYLSLAPKVFKSSWLRVPYLRARFDAEALTGELNTIIGDRTLDTPDLLTGYCVVAKRIDTGSPWILSNNPDAPYWESNKGYKLARLIRASTAAPTYFDPERLPIIENVDYGLFVDGGVSPYNSPTIALLMLAQLKAFKLCWPTGPDNLKIVSVGTGTHRKRMSPNRRRWTFLDTITVAIPALRTVIDDTELQSLMLMQWLGDCPQRWWINSEILDMPGDRAPHGPLFRFFRYDVRLEKDWFKEQADLDVDDDLVNHIRELDEVRLMPESYKIARAIAQQQVRPEDWTWPERAKPAMA
jgi:hypothetical protein